MRYITWITALWTVCVAWCQISGWALTIFGQLNRIGYLCSFSILGIALIFFRSIFHGSVSECQGNKIFSLNNITKNITTRQRGFRLFQTIFFIICIVSLFGGIINRPFGWDAYAYRIPRVLRWLQEEKWIWLMAGDSRMDISSIAQEWQIAPLISLFGTDRLIFITNFIPYCLFPSLIYLASRSLGIKRYWALLSMWMIPLGYCFSLSSAGVQNDGVGGIHAVAALAFLHPRCHEFLSKPYCILLSLINVALITGLKLSSVPLAGILFLYIMWSIRADCYSLLRRPLLLVTGLATCLISSIAPMACINYYHEKAISGDANNNYTCEAKNPVAACVVNLGFFGVDALTPNPFSGVCNELSSKLLNESDFSEWCLEHYPLSRTIRFAKLAYEGAAGPGFPLLIALPVLLFYAWRKNPIQKVNIHNLVFFTLTLSAFVVYLAKLSSNASPRISAPYFPILILSFLSMSAPILIVRHKMNCIIYSACSLLVLMSLVVMSSRPILPQGMIRAIDPHANFSYSHQRFVSYQAGKFLEKYDQPIYYVSDWGAITHRLFVPFREKGKSVEVGSVEWNRNPPTGAHLFAFTTLGIENRFGMRVDKFLELVGPAKIIDSDNHFPSYAKDNAFFLCEIKDISKVPPPLFSRTYHNHRKLLDN